MSLPAAQTAHTVSPIAHGKHNCIVASGLPDTNKKGRLQQYRAKIAADMAHTPVLIEDAVVLDQILALPPSVTLPEKRERQTCPFAELEHAKDMKEAEVSALFVSTRYFLLDRLLWLIDDP